MNNIKVYKSNNLEIFITYFNQGFLFGFSVYKNITYKPFFNVSINLVCFNIEIFKSK